MRKEKGQDIIEYALMLAMVVGIGFGIYSYGGQGIVNSISNVFNNAGSLLDSASLPAASSPEDIIKRLGDGRNKGLADILQGEGFEIIRTQQSTPAIKDLNQVCTCFYLAFQIGDGSISDHLQ